jgi:hypothetical protein
VPVFYRGPQVRITDKVIEVPRLCKQRYPLDDVDGIHVVQFGPDTDRVPLLGTSVLASVFITVPVTGQASTTVAAVVGLVSVVCAGACFRARRQTSYELRARCRGEAVTVLLTADRSELEQVYRALRRAVEFRDDTT